MTTRRSRSLRSLRVLCAAALVATPAAAEISLPDATLWGVIRDDAGATVTSGSPVAVIEREGAEALRAAGSFVEEGDETFYIVRVPFESSIGAPGPSGAAARDGDVLGRLELDGRAVVLDSAAPPLAMGLAARLDGRAGGGPGLPPFIRGDCNRDLSVDISDASFILGFLFLGTIPPRCDVACDGNDDDAVNISDASYILGFLFLGGPAPAPPTGVCGRLTESTPLGCVEPVCPQEA